MPEIRRSGDQMSDNTRNVGTVLFGLVSLVAIAKEYGLDPGTVVDPRWIAFFSDGRVIVGFSTVVLWAGNLYRKSRFKLVFDHHVGRVIDRLDGPDPAGD